MLLLQEASFRLFTNYSNSDSHTTAFCSFLCQSMLTVLSLSFCPLYFYCPRNPITPACPSVSSFIESVSWNLI